MSLVLPAVLSYDGTALTESVDGMPRLVSRLVRGLDTSAEVRGQDTVIPGAPGRVSRERIFDRRVIELEVTVLGTGATEVEQRIDTRVALDTLGTLFVPTRDPATLVIEVEDATTRSIEARPVNLLHDEGEVPSRRVLSVELEAVGDDWAAS